METKFKIKFIMGDFNARTSYDDSFIALVGENIR